MKITHLTTLKHKLQWLVLLAALLGVSHGVWGDTTYYLLWGTSNNPTEMVSKGSVTASSSWEWTMDASFSSGTNYYFAVSTSSTYTGIISDKNYKTDDIVDASSICSTRFTQSYNVSVNNVSTTYYFYGIAFSSAQSTIKVTFDGEHYTISNSSDAIYSLRGEFTGWEARAVTFSKSGGTYTASIDLPAYTEYETSANGGATGFKICKNGNTWYGFNGTITKDSYSSKTFSSDYNCGLTTRYAGTYTFTFTLSGTTPVVTVTYPTATPTVPTVRWGQAPSIDGSKNIKATAYIAAQGCNGTSQQTISNIRVRFWKDGDEENAQTLTTADGTYNINTHYNVTVAGVTTIPASNSILMSCDSPTDIYMEVAGKSSIGWSDYSDRVKIRYTADHNFLITTPWSKTFNACSATHQFNLTDIVLPEPDSFTATLGGSDVTTSDFSRSGDVITWKKAEKESGTQYSYTFTFAKDGYEDSPQKTATVNLTYSATAPTAEIGDIVASETSTTPYVTVTLTSSIPSEKGIDHIEWYVDKADASRVFLTPSADTESCTFRAQPYYEDEHTYTVYAKGVSTTCGTTEEKTIEITVNNDPDTCNP